MAYYGTVKERLRYIYTYKYILYQRKRFNSWEHFGGRSLDSIAASLFVLNWLGWQIVSDDKIQITILILRRGALSKGLFNKSLKNAHSVNVIVQPLSIYLYLGED